MAWFNDQWLKLKEGAKRTYAGTRERVRNFKWRNPSKPVLIWTGSIVGVLLVGWITLNILLANPSTGTPMINWALGTFGNKDAKVQTGHLEHPFSDRFILRALDWPGTIQAKQLDISYDLFGFFPGHPWAKRIWVRDGEILLPEQTENDAKTTFNPQQWVNEIDAANVDIRFTTNKKKRVVNVVTAYGSFSNGSVRAEATSGKNHLTFDGLQRDWGGSLKGSVTAKGENLKDLAEIAGASAPDTPPFNVRGALLVQSQTWSVENLAGRMGDSDLGGLVRINLAQKKPMLTVNLKSHKLDFDDLGVVFGLPMGTGKGETENDEQVKAKQAYDRSARLIPDSHIDFSRLAAVNADIKFAATKVVDAPAGISSMSLDGTLRDSVLDFAHALVKSGSGDLDAKIRINAQKDPAITRATGTLENVAIAKLVPTDLVRGSLNGKFALDMRGSGFREAAGSATGEVGVWSNNSELKKFAVEGAGLDLGEILLLWAKDDADDYIRSRCLAANIALKDGQAKLQPAVIENKDSLVVASGGVNLKNEAIDIQLYAKPHDVSIGTISGDIRITGTLRHPGFQALDEKTFLQAGLSALLSSISGPLALLPFVQTGGEPDAPCGQLLADAKETNPHNNPAAKVEPKKG
ncbi:MAG: AsmA family protein [Hyphomonadaceae bacterium]